MDIMVKVDRSKIGLVRGYFVYSQWRAGMISMEKAVDPYCIDVNVAYTPWHRHDDNPYKVENELEELVDFYSHFDDYEGGMMGFEYREYSK